MATSSAEPAELRTVETWYATALKAAVEQGRIRHAGFGRYAPIGGRRD